VLAAAAAAGVAPGAVNPNLFQAPEYAHGSLANADPAIRQRAIAHCIDCAHVGRALGSRDVSLWCADGSNYPGTADIRARKRLFAEGLARVHDALSPAQRLLIEYKPFEPAFYHTDIADWGMALLLARAAGAQAKVLVDTGHHYLSQNIEQIVAWLLDEEMLGGFHFNDRRYADDDLTLGSIDPYQVFRIFHEIGFYEWQTGTATDIAYVVDQGHNLKGTIEAMLQTVSVAQALFAKAALVDYERLADAQRRADLVRAESCLQDAFATDVRPAIGEWRRARGLPDDPIEEFRASGYLEQVSRERTGRPPVGPASYA
jgi:L-rhamnose isomerase/sugar isomerase